MYLISVMIFTFSIRDFGHPEFSEIPIWTPCYENPGFGHPVMKILAWSLVLGEAFSGKNNL